MSLTSENRAAVVGGVDEVVEVEVDVDDDEDDDVPDAVLGGSTIEVGGARVVRGWVVDGVHRVVVVTGARVVVVEGT